jgi:hypothetical protein
MRCSSGPRKTPSTLMFGIGDAAPGIHVSPVKGHAGICQYTDSAGACAST